MLPDGGLFHTTWMSRLPGSCPAQWTPCRVMLEHRCTAATTNNTPCMDSMSSKRGWLYTGVYLGTSLRLFKCIPCCQATFARSHSVWKTGPQVSLHRSPHLQCTHTETALRSAFRWNDRQESDSLCVFSAFRLGCFDLHFVEAQE